MQPSGFQHPKCYAREIGGCSTKISKEHYVTEALLKEVAEGQRAVRVSNHPLLPTSVLGPEQFGLRALTGHILCKTHNSLLSDFDTTAVTLFKHLDFLNGTSHHAAQPTVPISGDRFERWMLKTLLGTLYGGAIPVLPGMEFEEQLPPVELLRVIFDNQPIPVGQGLFLNAGRLGEAFTADHNVLQLSIAPSRDGRVIGLRVRMFGIMFSLILMNFTDGLPEELREGTYRPSNITIEPGGSVPIEWTGQVEARPVHILHLGSAEPR
jgi:hypothetical protein